MYVSPNHPNPPRQAVPPEEQGQRLATFPRGPGVELRVCLDAYEGHDYLTLRVWERDRDGGFWPTKKGVSVRLKEAQPLAAVLAEAARGAFKASNRGRGRPVHNCERENSPSGEIPQLECGQVGAGAHTPSQQEFNEFE